MNFRKVNNLTGWVIFLIASAVYVLTMEPTGSLWDCGEFVASAYKLQIPHPPGAPLFVLMGRFFIILFGDNGTRAALAVNFMSAIASGFTILFLFWSITHFARKIVAPNGAAPDRQQMFSIMAAGAVGALAYTFTDSFWFSAVEGEVYACSSFFTAIAFWAILKWEHEVDYDAKHGIALSQADRWVVFIFFIMGLSVGVHLLNLLTIPAIVMLYYFKRYKVTKWGTVLAFIIGCIVTGVVQVAIIQWSIKGAGAFDRFFVNQVNLPFFSGFAIYFILIAVLLIIGLRFKEAAIKKFSSFAVWLVALLLIFSFPILDSGSGVFLFLLGLGTIMALCYVNRDRIINFLRVAVWSILFLILGYSSYFTTLIRSTANPGVDMYNVDNPVSLVGYLSREQYGDWPIVYGPDYIYRPQYKTTGDLYVKGDKKYIMAGKIKQLDFSAKPDQGQLEEIMKQHPDWDESKIGPHLFPRMWDNGNDRGQEDAYKAFGNVGDDQPTLANNIAYFVSYQFRVMYFRYFMWNFSGKQNDLQGFGNIRDGNWITGIGFIDKMKDNATTQELPATAGRQNKANNKMYMLPFILGVLGFIYQLTVNRRDWLINSLLFFFTGFAIVIYLNQAGYQPRERDYAYVGSFYAFAIWIGLGVLQVRDWIRQKSALSTANYISFAVCMLAVPVLMASQEWDDHDRHHKTLARDLGRDYLESCAKDAILISFGDNDTYPVWYAQEVENSRPDIRVMNYSLLGTDWYINQLRYKVNQSAPADVIFSADQIEGSKRDVIPVYPIPGFDQNRYYDLYSLLKDVVGSDDNRYQVPSNDGDMMNVLPVKKVSVPVDVNYVKSHGIVNPGDSVVSNLQLDIKKSYLLKNDLAVLALIAANKWQRPIYFTSLQDIDDLGLAPYIRMEGMSYRLVPVKNSDVNTLRSYDVMTSDKFQYGSANKPGVYFDEENRRHINSIRSSTSILAMALCDQNQKDSARKVLHRYDDNVSLENCPYGFTSNRGNMHDRISMSFLLASYRAGDLPLAKKVSASIKSDLNEQLRYYRMLGDQQSNDQIAQDAMSYMQNKPNGISDKQVPFVQDIYSSFQMLVNMDDWEKQYAPAPAKGLETNPVMKNDSAPPTRKDTPK